MITDMLRIFLNRRRMQIWRNTERLHICFLLTLRAMPSVDTVSQQGQVFAFCLQFRNTVLD